MGTLPELLGGIEDTEWDIPTTFKENVLGILQLYFDGLVEKRLPSPDINPWREQERALDALLKGARIAVSDYFRREKEIRYDAVREIVLPHAPSLIRYGSTLHARGRHLFNVPDFEYQANAIMGRAADLLADRSIDTVVPIASGGFEPALLLTDYLQTVCIVPVRWSRSRIDPTVRVPSCAPSGYGRREIGGKNIIISEDFSDTGKTVAKVMDWVRTHAPTQAYLSTGLPSEPEAELMLARCGLVPYEKSKTLYIDFFPELRRRKRHAVPAGTQKKK